MPPEVSVPLVELEVAAGSPIVMPEEPPTLVVWPALLVVMPVSPSMEVEPSSLTMGMLMRRMKRKPWVGIWMMMEKVGYGVRGMRTYR